MNDRGIATSSSSAALGRHIRLVCLDLVSPFVLSPRPRGLHSLRAVLNGLLSYRFATRPFSKNRGFLETTEKGFSGTPKNGLRNDTVIVTSHESAVIQGEGFGLSAAFIV